MKSVSEQIVLLEAICRRLAVDFRIVRKIPGRFRAPFSELVGCDFKKRVVYVAQKNRKPCEAIHELGHLICHGTAEPPISAKDGEYEFFGWEVALAIKLGLLEEWVDQCKTYVVTNPTTKQTEDLFFLTEDEQAVLFEERIRFARKRGFLTSRNHPRMSRRKPLINLL